MNRGVDEWRVESRVDRKNERGTEGLVEGDRDGEKGGKDEQKDILQNDKTSPAVYEMFMVGKLKQCVILNSVIF